MFARVYLYNWFTPSSPVGGGNAPRFYSVSQRNLKRTIPYIRRISWAYTDHFFPLALDTFSDYRGMDTMYLQILKTFLWHSGPLMIHLLFDSWRIKVTQFNTEFAESSLEVYQTLCKVHATTNDFFFVIRGIEGTNAVGPDNARR